MTRTRLLAFTVGCAVAWSFVALAHAQEVTYAGKTIRVIVPAGAGGVYGLYVQVVGPYLRRYLPGNPEIVPQYMPGGGGIVAANFLANAAPKDGTVIGMPHDSLVIYQVLHPDKVKYDARQFRWIGTIGGQSSTLSVWHLAPVKSIDDAKRSKSILGATGRGSFMYMVPRLMNAVLGTQFDIVTGYKGVAEIDLAMERGEVHGRGGSWLSWKSTKPDWVRDHKVVNLVQFGWRKTTDLPAVPLLADLASSEEAAQMFRFVSSIGLIGRGLALPGGVADDVVSQWREAFYRTTADPDLLNEAERRLIDVEPISGPDVEAAVAQILATPLPVKERLRDLIGD